MGESVVGKNKNPREYLPEVSLLFRYFSLSKCTSGLSHRASSTTTFPSSLAQLTKLEEKNKTIDIKVQVLLY